jgi:hypothetical protein
MPYGRPDVLLAVKGSSMLGWLVLVFTRDLTGNGAQVCFEVFCGTPIIRLSFMC